MSFLVRVFIFSFSKRFKKLLFSLKYYVIFIFLVIINWLLSIKKKLTSFCRIDALSYKIWNESYNMGDIKTKFRTQSSIKIVHITSKLDEIFNKINISKLYRRIDYDDSFRFSSLTPNPSLCVLWRIESRSMDIEQPHEIQIYIKWICIRNLECRIYYTTQTKDQKIEISCPLECDKFGQERRGRREFSFN